MDQEIDRRAPRAGGEVGVVPDLDLGSAEKFPCLIDLVKATRGQAQEVNKNKPFCKNYTLHGSSRLIHGARFLTYAATVHTLRPPIVLG